MLRQIGAHHLAALSALVLLAAGGIYTCGLSEVDSEAVRQTEVRLALLARLQALDVERADRDAGFHRAANRLLITRSDVDTGAAREILDGALALKRKGEALESYLAVAGSVLPEKERKATASAAGAVLEAIAEIHTKAELLAALPENPDRLEAVGSATATLSESLIQARTRVGGSISRSRERVTAAIRGTRLWGAVLLGAALVLAGSAWRKRAKA